MPVVPPTFRKPIVFGVVTASLLLAALSGAQGGAAADPSPLLLGTGLAAPNTSGAVTALKSSAGTALDAETIRPGGTALLGVASSLTGWDTIGVLGKTNSKDGNSAGVWGYLNNGLPGAGAAGVIGLSQSTNTNGPGVFGRHLSIIGTAPGVLGETDSSSSGAAGVFGTSPAGYGVVGLHQNAAGTTPGVFGETNSTSASAVGVLGQVNPAAAGPGSAAVRGVNKGTGSWGVGVWGSQGGKGYGVYGSSPFGYGVVGAAGTKGFAGYFFGNVYVSGRLSKAAGGFEIDHPLDPAHKFLQHSFVESPDMKDVYDGIATTNAKGFAVVKLPNYFQALNRTSATSSRRSAACRRWPWRRRSRTTGSRSRARSPIRASPGRSPASGTTGMRTRTGSSRQEKPRPSQGKYLHPELYGQPKSKTTEGVLWSSRRAVGAV